MPDDWRSSSGAEFDPEFHQTCDRCGAPGMSDSDGFALQGDGQVFCRECDSIRESQEAPHTPQDQ